MPKRNLGVVCSTLTGHDAGLFTKRRKQWVTREATHQLSKSLLRWKVTLRPTACVHTYTLNKRLIFASRAGEYAQSICSYKNLLKTTSNNRQRLWYFWTIHVQISGNCLKRFWAEGFKRTMSAGLETTLMWRHIRRINFHLTLCTSHCFSSPLRWEPPKDLKDILLTYSRHPSWQLSL